MNLLALALLAFCRVTLGLVFGIAFLGKIRDPAGFTDTSAPFAPPRRVESGGGLALSRWRTGRGDPGHAGGAIVGRRLLAGRGPVTRIFPRAHLRRIRQIDTTCACFGPQQHPVSSADLWRNGGFLSCALAGWLLAGGLTSVDGELSFGAWVLVGISPSFLLPSGHSWVRSCRWFDIVKGGRTYGANPSG